MVVVIICTGHSALVDEEKAKELGLAAYVMQPINMSEIAQTIRKVLVKSDLGENSAISEIYVNKISVKDTFGKCKNP